MRLFFSLIFTLFLVLSSSITGSAQTFEFAPIGAKWKFYVKENTSATSGAYTIVESIKDTIIEGKSCKKLSSGETFYQNSNDSVFIYDKIDSRLELIYDFSSNGEPFYSEFCEDSIFIDEVVIVNKFGADRKRYLYRAKEGFGCEFDNYIYEGVGSEKGLFFPFWQNTKSYYLECYEDNSNTHSCGILDFAPIGAKWSYKKECIFIGDCPSVFYEVKDTIRIKNKLCSVITNSEHNDADLTVYEDSGKVYFYEVDSFYLLFDFTKNIGDTLYYNIPSKHSYYNVSNCWGDSDSILNCRSKIVDIMKDTINGENIKVFVTEEFFETQGGLYNEYYLGAIYENIGCLSGLIGNPSGVCHLGGGAGYLRCYEDDDISLKFTLDDCDVKLGASYPTQTKLNVSYKDNRFLNISGNIISPIKEVVVYDILGKRQQLVRLNQNLYNIELKKGVHICHLLLENGNIITKKILVN